MATVMAFDGGSVLRAEMPAAVKNIGRGATPPCSRPARVGDDDGDDQPAVLLTDGDRAEVLDCLAARPVHAVIMSGLIRDNGVESPYNRGAFYGVRDSRGDLEGVALVGRVSMFEARSERALRALAQRIVTGRGCELVFADEASAEALWGDRAPGEQQQQQQLPSRRTTRRELWYELRRDSLPPPAEVAGADAAGKTVLRRATPDDLESVVRAHAEVTRSECGGDDPLAADPQGFRRRCLRRVEMGRVWVLVERGRLVFKADVAAETPDALYLEGVYVDARERGRGVGRRCLSRLSRDLLLPSRAGALCLLVEEQNYQARRLYDKCGFADRGRYRSIFLGRP